MEGLPVSYSLNSGDNGNNWWGDFIGAASCRRQCAADPQ